MYGQHEHDHDNEAWIDEEVMAEHLILALDDDFDELPERWARTFAKVASVCRALYEAGIEHCGGVELQPGEAEKQMLVLIDDRIRNRRNLLSIVADVFMGDHFVLQEPVGVFWVADDQRRLDMGGTMMLRFCGDADRIKHVMGIASEALKKLGLAVGQVKGKKKVLEIYEPSTPHAADTEDLTEPINAVRHSLSF